MAEQHHVAHIKKRRTFAIISHPDAGKTTITEKLLLYGGAIQMAGMVKAKKSKKFATSDWMDIEKQRGISVTSSVMNFPYLGYEINLIDTPGHQDFSEDTYRTLTAVDSVLMLIDAANGVEEQTKKLFEVCRMQKIPVMAFINKMDREGRDPFVLMDEIEKVLGIRCTPFSWPIGMGASFRGVYHRMTKQLYLYEPVKNHLDKSRAVKPQQLNLNDPALEGILGIEETQKLRDDIELLDIAQEQFSLELYRGGQVAPLFFGSALNNFGVQMLLDMLVQYAPEPQPRASTLRVIDPKEETFSAFIFKIQANMDPGHRDRVAFMRICSGRFTRGMKAFHVRQRREMRLGRPTQFLAQDRSLVDEAYAGDIVGIHDPGVFKIGDTLTEGEVFQFKGIPVFAPEHFVRVELKDPLKSKQLNKALLQLSEEGAVQVFRPLHGNHFYLGVVGILQLDVVKYRVEHEYGVKVVFHALPYEAARWMAGEQNDIEKIKKNEAQHICWDQHEQPAILLTNAWRLKYLEDKYPGLTFYAASENVVGIDQT